MKPFVYSDSSGYIFTDSHQISIQYNVKIEEAFIGPGSNVQAGDPLFEVSSVKFNAQIVQFLMHLSDQKATEAELNIRLAVAKDRLPSTLQRANVAANNLDKISDQACSGTSVFCSQIYKEHALAHEALALTRAEIQEIANQLEILETSRRSIEDELAKLKQYWNGGIVEAPMKGILDPTLASVGDTVPSGSILAKILFPETIHVNWILSGNFLKPPNTGDPVYIIHDGRIYNGLVQRILPVSEVSVQTNNLLPRETTGQIIKVKFVSDVQTPPLLSQVEIRYNYWRSMDKLVEGYVGIMKYFGLWRTQNPEIAK
jgi:multidrug resistance efflux pump